MTDVCHLAGLLVFFFKALDTQVTHIDVIFLNTGIARLRDEIRRLQATELVLADDPMASQASVDDRTGGYRGPRKYGRAANEPPPGADGERFSEDSAASLPATRARKPTLDEMGPHNLGGGLGRPLGAESVGRSKAGRGGTRAFRGKRKG